MRKLDKILNHIQNKKYKVKRAPSGLGLFATEDINKGEYIVEFTGPILNNKQRDEKGGRYLFEINPRETVDGSGRNNIARYINHSCRPNCEADIWKKRVFIQARKKIKTGEELSFDYGKEYFDYYIKPLGCKCIKCTKN